MKEQGRQYLERTKRLLDETEALGNIGGWELDMRTGKSFWTDNLYRLFGYDPGENQVDHETFMNDIVHAADRERLQQLFALMLRTGNPVSAEFRILRADKEERTFKGVVVPETNDEGEIVRVCGANMDITNKKRAEQALLASQQKYQDAQHIARMGHWELDVQNNILRWSDGTHELFGVDRMDFGSDLETFYSYIHPDDRELVQHAFEESLKNKTQYDIVHRIIRPDGEIRYMHERCETVYDEKGTPLRALGSVQDVTDMRLAAEELRRNLEVNMALARLYAPIVSPNATIETAAIVVLEEARKLTGSEFGYVGTLNKDKALELHTISNMMDLCAMDEKDRKIIFPPDENGNYPALWGHSLNTRKPLLTNDIASHPASIGTPEGHIPLNNLITIPVMLGDEIVGQIALANTKEGFDQADMALVMRFADFFALAVQRMRSSQALSASRDLLNNILTGIGAGIITIVPETLLVEEINDVALKMLGGNREDYVGKGCDQFCWKRMDGESVDKCPLRHSEVLDKEMTIRLLDGSSLPIQKTVLRDTVEGKSRYLEIIFDISDRKALERQLALAHKMESIGQLSAGIAHEINTPSQFLGDNLMFMDEAFKNLEALLREYRKTFDLMELTDKDRATAQELKALWEEWDVDYLLEEIPPALSQSQEGIKRVTSIVRAMKRFSHPGADDRQLCDINEALEKTSVVCRNEWKYHADMIYDFADDLPPVPCYINDLNQVILNVLINAAHAMDDKYGPENGKGTITLRTRQDGDWVEIIVEDTGGGIPEDVLPRIFDPFFTTKEVGKGTGQGLSLSYSIIKNKHEGTIDFESEVGQGTTCTIRLPLAVQENG